MRKLTLYDSSNSSNHHYQGAATMMFSKNNHNLYHKRLSSAEMLFAFITLLVIIMTAIVILKTPFHHHYHQPGAMDMNINNIQAILLQHINSPDSIGWINGGDVPHNGTYCIDPPPFGTQCTVHMKDSITACLSMSSSSSNDKKNVNCHAITCPDPTPYLDATSQENVNRGIHGAVCQMRGSVSSIQQWKESTKPINEKNHGMCQPDGCHNFFFSPVQLNPHGMKVLFQSTRSSTGVNDERTPILLVDYTKSSFFNSHVDLGIPLLKKPLSAKKLLETKHFEKDGNLFQEEDDFHNIQLQMYSFPPKATVF